MPLINQIEVSRRAYSILFILQFNISHILLATEYIR